MDTGATLVVVPQPLAKRLIPVEGFVGSSLQTEFFDKLINGWPEASASVKPYLPLKLSDYHSVRHFFHS